MWLCSGFPRGILCGMRAQGTCSKAAQLVSPRAAGLEHPPAREGGKGAWQGQQRGQPGVHCHSLFVSGLLLGLGGKKSNRTAP